MGYYLDKYREEKKVENTFVTCHLECENDHKWSTSVNGSRTDKELEQYFLGSMFCTSPYPLEIMSKCVKITIER
jgi:hypothetical protein